MKIGTSNTSRKFSPRVRTKKEPHWKHQKLTKALLRKEPRVYDTSDPGTGKTRSAVEEWYARKKKCLLVLAPKTILKSTWAKDLDKYVPSASYTIAYSTNREKAFAENVDVYITNLDAVKWLAKQKPSFFVKFDTVVIDEITAFKHRTSQRSKAAAKIMKYFKYREGLTGTPNSNSITDVWHQMKLLDDGQRLGNNFFQFRGATQTPKQVGPSANMVKWEDKDDAIEAVGHLIRDITIRHEFDKCMDIPKNFTHTVTHTLPAKLMRQYDILKADAVLQLQQEDVTALNAAVLRDKLMQVASGAVYTSEKKYEVVDFARYEMIADLVEQRKHSIVFFRWTHQKEQLLEEFKRRKLSHAFIDGTVPIKRREAIVDQYQAGFFQTLLLHPQTGAHGLTLTKGTATIWASPIYQPDFLKQGKHRIWRGGQKKKTETILIEAEDTIEGFVYNRLNEKNTRMLNLLEILRGD
jgi:SNF2 family DNA or RNA helicase